MSSAIERVIQVVGSQSELARRLGITPQSVQQWVAAKHVPAKRVIAIERATGGKVSRREAAQPLGPVRHAGQCLGVVPGRAAGISGRG